MKSVVKILSTMIIMCMIIFLSTGCSFMKNYDRGSIRRIEVTIYLKDGLKQSEIDDIDAYLKSIEGVTEVEYTSKSEALIKAKEKLSDNADLLSQYTETSHPFPASFCIVIRTTGDVDDIIEEIKSLNGVKEVDVFDAGMITKIWINTLNKRYK